MHACSYIAAYIAFRHPGKEQPSRDTELTRCLHPVVNISINKMAGLTLLLQMKKELIPYILEEELVDEKNSEKIGNGAYGTIKKIRYCGTPCAAKEIHSILLQDVLAGISNIERDESLSKVKFRKGNPESLIVEKFCAEMKILSEIRHPNFVRFIGVYLRESSPFPILVMELMHTSLAQCLTRCEGDKNKFPLGLKLFILQDVARALVYLHSRDPPILHRDLTANNVLLTSSMKAKVSDLGVAKIMDIGISKLTQCPGALVYMPPEALTEHPSYGTELDIYSYGVLGFHTFSGKWPLPRGSPKSDGSGLCSDPERCYVDLIGEGVCLKGTLEKCVEDDPKKRLKALEILMNVEKAITELEIEESDFLETYYIAQHNTELVKEMSERVTDLSRDLKSREEYIKKLESVEQKNNVAIGRLRCGNEEKISAIKLLEEEKAALNQEIKTLRKTVEHQESNIQELSSDKSAQSQINSLQRLIEVEREALQPCQNCSMLEKEKEDLSSLVTSVKAQTSNLSLQIETKEEQLVIKKREVESKEKQVEQLNEKIKLMDEEIESTKSLNSRYMERSLSSESDNSSLINSLKIEQSEKNVELLETIKSLKKQLSENDGKHKMIQDRYRKVLQDLLIPHKVASLNLLNITIMYIYLQGILCSSPPCTILSCNLLADGVNLKPADRILPIVQNIRNTSSSTPAVYYDSKIFFLCEIYFKKPKQVYMGATVWYDPLEGKFDAIKDQEMVCFGHFGTTLLGLAKNKRFFLLTDYAWESASIPPLPADDLQNPIILTYHSFLIIVNGNVIWVHDDDFCDWMQFELSVEGRNFEGSPKNSFAILSGKLFVCSSSEEMVYSVELQQVVDITLNYSNSKANENSVPMKQEHSKPKQDSGTMEDALKDAISDDIQMPDKKDQQMPDKKDPPKQILQLNRIFKGATFIFPHATNLLAFHNTPASIDRVWYYDVRCYHWHNVEYNSSDASGAMLKNWVSMSDCAGILHLSLPSAWSITSWGHAKLYEIQLVK